MDFLDPRTKKSRRRRILASYLVMSGLVVISAFVLIYSSLGYGINTKTGQIVQNGLVFIDSKPLAADIYINGQKTSQQTSARLVLSAGKYTLSLNRSGYRTWSTSIKLSAQDVWRFKYPLLFPTKLHASQVATLKNNVFTSQSPDRHWLLAGSSSPQLSVSQLDMTSSKPSFQALTLPSSLASFSGGNWQAIGWSGDNSKLLVEHIAPGHKELLVISRSKPTQSFNISQRSKIDANLASFQPNSSAKLYIQAASGDLYSFDSTSNHTTKILKNVGSYWATGSHLIYTTNKSGKEIVNLWDGSKSYPLTSLPAKTVIAVSAATYQSQEYYVVAYGEVVTIYQNPLVELKSSAQPKSFARLPISNPTLLSFSPDHHLLIAGSGQIYSSYNFDSLSSNRFKVQASLASLPQWLDSYHLGARSTKSQGVIFDFNGDNQQVLLPSQLANGQFIRPDLKTIYTQTNSGSSTALNAVSLVNP